MWLPTPIYERTPQLWLLMGVLFVALSLYIGFAYTLTYFYILLGGFCTVRGVQTLQMRRNYRRAPRDEAEDADASLVEAAGGRS